jgi:hypothetical protein
LGAVPLVFLEVIRAGVLAAVIDEATAAVTSTSASAASMSSASRLLTPTLQIPSAPQSQVIARFQFVRKSRPFCSFGQLDFRSGGRTLPSRPEGSTVDQVTTPSFVEASTEAAFEWRLENLLRAGYDERSSLLIALTPEIDLHSAIELLEKGCALPTALRILL